MITGGGAGEPGAAGGLARHIPVLGPRAVEFLAVHDGGLYIDATFGAGGYARAILGAADCRVIGIDRDQSAIARGADLKVRVKQAEDRTKTIENALLPLLLLLPQPPDAEVHIGKDDAENVELKKWGEIRHFDFPPKDHTAIGVQLDGEVVWVVPPLAQPEQDPKAGPATGGGTRGMRRRTQRRAARAQRRAARRAPRS